MSEVISGSLTLLFAPCREEIGKPGFHSSTDPWGSTFMLKRFFSAQIPLFSSQTASKETDPWVLSQAHVLQTPPYPEHSQPFWLSATPHPLE